MDARSISENIKALAKNGAVDDEEAARLSAMLASNSNVVRLNWIVMQLTALNAQLQAGQLTPAAYAEQKLQLFT